MNNGNGGGNHGHSNFKHGTCLKCGKWGYIDTHHANGLNNLCLDHHREEHDIPGGYSAFRKPSGNFPLLDAIAWSKELGETEEEMVNLAKRMDLLLQLYFVKVEAKRRQFPRERSCDNG